MYTYLQNELSLGGEANVWKERIVSCESNPVVKNHRLSVT